MAYHSGDWILDIHAFDKYVFDKDYVYSKKQLEKLEAVRLGGGFGGPYDESYNGVGLALTGIASAIGFFGMFPLFGILCIIVWFTIPNDPNSLFYIFSKDYFFYANGGIMGVFILFVLFLLSPFGVYGLICAFSNSEKERMEQQDREYNLHIQIEKNYQEKINDLESTRQQELKQVDELNSLLDERDAALQKLVGIVNEKDRELEKKEVDVVKKDAEVAKLSLQLSKVEMQLLQMQKKQI
ncbi:MAG: hypothetical protein ACI37O_05325 [Candidatus Avelusimicrobium sp.]|uniref:hypothetical protein n=1 Tax=Candidatus Avelusimicrobium sp. TaxID=3048833 RepID=UPI003F087926